MTKRLDILKASLEKKEAEMNAKISEHFATVKEANGQPLNDKRNGAATMGKWERQNASIRRVKEGIEKTKAAIEREESAIARVNGLILPSLHPEGHRSGGIDAMAKASQSVLCSRC